MIDSSFAPLISCRVPMPSKRRVCTTLVDYPIRLKAHYFVEIDSKQTNECTSPFAITMHCHQYPPRSHPSSVVQSVERRTVNAYVTGSSPVRGAKFKKACFLAGFLLSNYQRS